MSCLYRTLYSAKIVVFYAWNSKKQLFFNFFYKKTAKVFVLQKKDVPLHRIWALGYGVMVTLQILVLPFLVRIRVAQQIERGSENQNLVQFVLVKTFIYLPDATSIPYYNIWAAFKGAKSLVLTFFQQFCSYSCILFVKTDYSLNFAIT